MLLVAAALEVLGGVLVVCGLALAWLPLGLVAAGVALIVGANTLPAIRPSTAGREDDQAARDEAELAEALESLGLDDGSAE